MRRYGRVLDNCPPATTTLHVRAGVDGLRPDPAGSATHLDGTGYALPTRIRAFTADHITATDLTTLQLTVRSGAAYLTPICARLNLGASEYVTIVGIQC